MEVLKTDIFDKWLKNLRDRKASSIILVHINRMIEENFGKNKLLSNGVYEKKINYGPGYRLYFIKQSQRVIVLLCGGNKSTQQIDIQKAIKLTFKINSQTKG